MPFFIRDFEINFTLGPINFLGIFFSHDGNDLFRLNFVTKLSRLKNMLHLWSSRDLTPIGKNILVKTFALSQLVYLFLVLPNPPEHFINELESIIYGFIWAGKPDKIKRAVLINPIQRGGLKVIHVRTFINSLKCTWVRRYCDESNWGPWKLFFDLTLKANGGDFFFSCNCSPKDIPPVRNEFIFNVLFAWCSASFSEPLCDYGNQLLWNNSHIRINKTPVFIKFLYDKGVKYVRNIFHEDGSPLSIAAFKTNFNLVNFPFTIYLGLVNSIPREWRVDRSTCANMNILLLFKTKATTSVSRLIYPILSKPISKLPVCIEKWNKLFPEISENWSNIFTMSWANVSDAKLRYFHYKFLHRIIPTNRLLHLMGKTDSPNCTFCFINDDLPRFHGL